MACWPREQSSQTEEELAAATGMNINTLEGLDIAIGQNIDVDTEIEQSTNTGDEQIAAGNDKIPAGGK